MDVGITLHTVNGQYRVCEVVHKHGFADYTVSRRWRREYLAGTPPEKLIGKYLADTDVGTVTVEVIRNNGSPVSTSMVETLQGLGLVYLDGHILCDRWITNR
jgi:hypothetical protein